MQKLATFGFAFGRLLIAWFFYLQRTAGNDSDYRNQHAEFLRQFGRVSRHLLGLANLMSPRVELAGRRPAFSLDIS